MALRLPTWSDFEGLAPTNLRRNRSRYSKGPVFGDWTFLLQRDRAIQKGPVSEDWTF